MKDMIDKRNEKERMGRSVIKRWNVNYMPAQARPVAAEKSQEAPVEETAAEHYNHSTGSYSGLYGQKEIDEVELEQIEAILHEKSDMIQHIVDKGGKTD